MDKDEEIIARTKLYLTARGGFGLEDEELNRIGFVEYTGTVSFKPKERSITGRGPFSGRPGSELERKVEVPFRQVTNPEASYREVERRLAVMEGINHAGSLKANFWKRAEDYFNSQNPDFSGFADGAKLKDWGVFKPDEKAICLYTDGVFIPHPGLGRESGREITRKHLYYVAKGSFELKGKDLDETGLVEYVGTVSLDPREEGDVPFRQVTKPEASRSEVEKRLVIMEGINYIGSLKVNFWKRAVDFFNDKNPDFSDFADGAKLRELGLYQTENDFIRRFTDGTFFPYPEQEEAEEPAKPKEPKKKTSIIPPAPIESPPGESPGEGEGESRERPSL